MEKWATVIEKKKKKNDVPRFLGKLVTELLPTLQHREIKYKTLCTE